MAAKARGRKKAPEKLPKGTVLTDISKVSWELVEPIGSGGFGIIYSAKKIGSGVSASFAAKIEPHGNGPLFVERNFFLRNLKPEMLDEWKRKTKISFLGLPKYIGSGSHVYNGSDNRFLIMERFGENINSRLKSAGEAVNSTLLSTFCSQIIDSLMYIHEKGYAHMDIKPENLLLKYNSNNNQVYLIDFGIVDKYTTEATFKPDKKKEHNGTLLYCSRDSHSGVGTMRGDLEILGYNILVWCGFELPWTKDLKSPVIVQEKKIDFMSNLSKLKNKVPKNLIEYFDYVNSLKHNQTPDYNRVKSILSNLSDTSSSLSSNRKRKCNIADHDSPNKVAENGDQNVVKKANSIQKKLKEKIDVKTSPARRLRSAKK